MKINNRNILIASTLATVAALVLLAPIIGYADKAKAEAASPELFITWKSDSYVPPEYSGRALPTTGSELVAFVSLLDDGKIIDLSGQSVYWYVNGSQIEGGVGKTGSAFRVPGVAPNTISLRVQLPLYKGSVVSKTVNIPVVMPKVKLHSPYPDGNFSADSITLKAVPMFFNIEKLSELSAKWTVAGEKVEDIVQPMELIISVAAGTSPESTYPVSLFVSNPKRALEMVSDDVQLKYKPL